MMFSIIILLAVSHFGSHQVSPSFAPMSDLLENSKPSFGEQCRPDVGCNPGKLVRCSRNHICECIIKESMVYNRTLDSCVVTAGNTCQFDVKVSPRLPKKSVLAPCVNGASCTELHSKFTCNCNENLKYVPRIGACLPEVYGKVCNGSQDCLSPLVCNNNTCACPNTTVWSELYNDCVIKLSNTCNFDAEKDLRDLKCVPGAECVYIQGPRDQRYAWACECLEGFQESKTTKKGDHHCYGQYMTNCNGDLYGALSSEQCLPDLHCTTSGWGDSPACLCKYDYQQEYNNDAEKCGSLVDGPCEVTSDCIDPEAECKDVYMLGFKQCTCKQGYAPWERKCIIGLGHNCSLTERHSCDRASGLVCSSKGVCECPLLSEYNPQVSTCMPLLGGVCFKDECWPGMVCKPHRGMEYKAVGNCVCAEGYVPTAERKCHKDTTSGSSHSAKNI